MDLYTFIITAPDGRVIDLGTYYQEQCAVDTGEDSLNYHNAEGVRITVVQHNDDGSHSFKNQHERVLDAAEVARKTAAGY